MTKGLITIIGLVVSLGIIALGFFLVALPLYVQSLGVDAQTANVQSTNSIYEAQVANLRAEEENLDAINASVSELRAQIPSTANLDDVFEVVARAAESAGVRIVSITAGSQVGFATGGDLGADPLPDQSESTDGTSVPSEGGQLAAGRQQIDFAIQVIAPDLNTTTAFLDGLRVGPRLLSTTSTSATQAPDGTFNVQVWTLTFVDGEG